MAAVDIWRLDRSNRAKQKLFFSRFCQVSWNKLDTFAVVLLGLNLLYFFLIDGSIAIGFDPSVASERCVDSKNVFAISLLIR